MDQIFIEIDEKTKKEFKIWCIKNKTDMKTELTKYINKIILK